MKYDEDVIGKMDEAPLTLNMRPNYIISEKGKKSIIIRSKNHKKYRINVLLTISANV